MLQEAIDEYIDGLSSDETERSGGRRNTIAAYRNDLNQLCTYVSQQGIENWPQVTREQIAAYLLEMREQQGYRSTTIARKLAALKSFFRSLYSTGQIAIDPVEKLESPRIHKELPTVLSAEQVNSLFQQIDLGTPAGQRDLAMLHLMYATGMRVSELVSLNLTDFHGKQATVCCPGRNKRERVLPLPPIAVEAIQQYLNEIRPQLAQRHPEEESLFLNHHGERLTRQGFWLIIKGYARQAGITTITPHMLRHSFALLMVKGGMELRSVQELLGHAHISTTQVYSQLARSKTSG